MRKNYVPPFLEEIQIDKHISLIMMSGNGSGEIPPDPIFNKGEDTKKEDQAFGSPFED